MQRHWLESEGLNLSTTACRVWWELKHPYGKNWEFQDDWDITPRFIMQEKSGKNLPFFSILSENKVTEHRSHSKSRERRSLQGKGPGDRRGQHHDQSHGWHRGRGGVAGHSRLHPCKSSHRWWEGKPWGHMQISSVQRPPAGLSFNNNKMHFIPKPRITVWRGKMNVYVVWMLS